MSLTPKQQNTLLTPQQFEDAIKDDVAELNRQLKDLALLRTIHIDCACGERTLLQPCVNCDLV